MLVKKIISSALAALVLLATCATCLAQPQEGAAYGGAKAVAVAEASGMQYAVAYESESAFDVAGLCRLPALLYVCEETDRGTLDEGAMLSVSDAAASVSGQTAFISPGERIQTGLLLKAAVMITAGDACFALAESAAGSVSLAEKAIGEMLCGLGISCGDFTLMQGKQNMSAEELCKIASRLASSATYKKYSGLSFDEITHENAAKTELANPNKLLKTIDGCFAGSTGSSAAAGYSGIFAVGRDGVTFVAAVIGAKNADERASAAKEAIETAFASFRPVKAAAKGEIVAEGVPVTGGMKGTVNGVAAEDVVMLAKKDAQWNVMLEMKALTAPVKAGDVIGRALYSSREDEEPVSIDVLASDDVPEANLAGLIMEALRRWVHA